MYCVPLQGAPGSAEYLENVQVLTREAAFMLSLPAHLRAHTATPLGCVWGEVGGQWWVTKLVMPLVRGLDLGRYLQEFHGNMDEQVVLEVMLGLVCDVADVHELGLLHLDLKPANAMLRCGLRDGGMTGE